MPPLPEKFRAAIEKGVCNIKGKLCKLNADEKRQLLAILREHDDCPDGWKNTDSNDQQSIKKQQSILQYLHKRIKRLLNPEKARTASASANKKRRENGKAEEYAADPINKEKRAKYYADPINKEKRAKYNHEYKADPMNKDTRNERRRERYATDINYRTRKLLRRRLCHALKNNKKDHTMDLLGCTVEQMVQHIEKQFKPGMTWDNQGQADDEWQIDHIIPFVAFDTSNRDEQFIVCWYQNLQPLWGPDNRSKGGKYTEEGKQDLIRRYNEHSL